MIGSHAGNSVLAASDLVLPGTLPLFKFNLGALKHGATNVKSLKVAVVVSVAPAACSRQLGGLSRVVPAMSSDAEKEYIANGIQQNLRNDGRSCHEFRPIDVELGLVAQASGSSRVRLGSTDVVVGVKVEVGSPDPEAPNCGRLQATVELSPCASPRFEGKGGEEWALRLSNILESALAPSSVDNSAGINLRSLGIVDGKSCWLIYVDALVLNVGGNLLDAVSIAAKAALGNTRIPKVEIVADEEGGEAEIELDDDPESAVPVDTTRVPLVVTVSQVGSRSVVDLSREEEECSSSALHVAVTPQGQVCGMNVSGSGGTSIPMVREMTEVAEKLAGQLHKSLDSYMRHTATAVR
jgi:exosome complex component RRP42